MTPNARDMDHSQLERSQHEQGSPLEPLISQGDQSESNDDGNDTDFHKSDSARSDGSTSLASDASSMAGSEGSVKSSAPFSLYIVVPAEWSYCKLGVTCATIESRFGTYYTDFYYKTYPLPNGFNMTDARRYELHLLKHFSNIK